MEFPFHCRFIRSRKPDRSSTVGHGLIGLPTAGLALICVFAMGTASGAQEPGPHIGTLLAAGDIAKCDPASGKDEATAAILDDEIAKARTAGVPVRILALGDLAYDKGTEAEFRCYDASWGSKGKKAITLPVMGNHDHETESGKFLLKSFAAELNALYAAGEPQDGYYSLRFPDPASGPWQLIGLNIYAGLGKKSEQLQWLDAKLKASDAPCVLAFAHPFRFSSGWHGHDDNPLPKARVKFGGTIEPAYRVLHAHKASLLLTGHDHSFEQFAKQSADGVASADGVRSFVVGTGGAELYQSHRDRKAVFGPKNKLYRLAYKNRAPNSENYSQSSRGVLKIELYATGYRWKFLSIADDPAIALTEQFERCNPR